MHSNSDIFYVWTATDQSGRGTCGVTGGSERASVLLREALGSLTPGAVGNVRVAYLDRHARRPSYVYVRTVLRLRYVGDAAAIVLGD
ncbi:hypothetical protein SAMN05421874_1628 [Nonomuraea maritima]|uniref:Uncharacterized protein n=1 Tax=Nonomuraea maritima TaxID=683260 RepID=A0A1G9SNH3_9ACTN|nr:hypothetical protein [Nonomuraea maritima]SDM36877.1 hypothetical protein SAMN05421874_1628 [Nonomuraea maritima]